LAAGSRAEILRLERNAAARTTATPGGAARPEHILEDILEAAEAARAGATARRVGALFPPAEGLETAFMTQAASTARLAAEAFEALEARLALGIDLAGIERLSLVLVADDLIGRVELGKVRCRLGIVLVGVRMQLFCKLPEGALDLRGAGVARHPKDLIGVTHRSGLRNLVVSCRVSLPSNHPSMWGELAPKATRNRRKSNRFPGPPVGRPQGPPQGRPYPIADWRGAPRGRARRPLQPGQLRHDLAREQLDRAQRFVERQVAKDELADQIVAAGDRDLPAQHGRD